MTIYRFPIGTSTLEVDIEWSVHEQIVSTLLVHGKLYINQLARYVNASQREVYYAISDLRKAWVPLIGSTSGVYFTQDVQELKDYIKSVQKRNIEIIKDGTAIQKALSNTANLQSQLISTTAMPKRGWLSKIISRITNQR